MILLHSIPFPDLDPVALQLGPFSIRWYGLAYMAGLLLGWLYIRNLLTNQKLWPSQPPIAPVKTDDLLIWTALGVIAGGRIGFFLLYEPYTFIYDPLQVLRIWEGGMAFHGGLLGVISMIYIFSWRNKVSVFTIGDLIAAAVPIGIFFGRIANFINAEVYGRITTVPWGVIFPDVGPEPRHPSQLYEAVLEGLVLFLVLRYLIYYRKALFYPGFLSGMFFIGYACGRIFSEFFRAQDPGHTFTTDFFTAGIVYSIPMFLVGCYLIWRSGKQKVTSAVQ
ncbi:MAG: prolipoprotein diacylglyceryl transferase [Pseudomonadota bacterium]